MPISIKDIAKKTQERFISRKLKTVTNDTKIKFDNEPEIVTPVDNEPILENIPDISEPDVEETVEEGVEEFSEETETLTQEIVSKPHYKKKHKSKK